MSSCTNRIEYSLRNLCLGFILWAAAASTRADANSELVIHVPTIAHPYYHFVLDIPIDHPSQVNVEKLSANGQNIRSFVLEDKTDLPDPNQPNRKKRLAIYEAVISNRPEKTYESPQLVGRLDWQAGKTYSYLIDFLEDDIITYRILFMSSGAEAPNGMFPRKLVDEHPINDLFISASANLDFDDYPAPLIDLCSPERLFLIHWERSGIHKEAQMKALDQKDLDELKSKLWQRYGDSFEVIVPTPLNYY